MGQQVIDFVYGDEKIGLAENHTEFVGERVPDVTESVNENMKRLACPDSDLAVTIKNIKEFALMLNKSPLSQVIENTEQFTNLLKKKPWRLFWPSEPPAPEELSNHWAEPKSSGRPPAPKKQPGSRH
jgi:hypothetical protein